MLLWKEPAAVAHVLHHCRQVCRRRRVDRHVECWYVLEELTSWWKNQLL